MESFPSAQAVIGADINSAYVADLRSQLHGRSFPAEVRVFQGDFYGTDWSPLLQELADPLLVIGNPPWVTNAGLSAIGSSNLPEKSNFQKYAGLDAITGKSNFDISEWMLIRELEWLNGRRGTLAMLCKTTVARKVLLHAWKKSKQLLRSEIYLIDAMDYFDAAVDAKHSVRRPSQSSRGSLRERVWLSRRPARSRPSRLRALGVSLRTAGTTPVAIWNQARLRRSDGITQRGTSLPKWPRRGC
ncbi:MAG: hypothetical protein DMG25_07190 [Acidobacteria bacterium]|nr:MAG: hypothetical protein DMG25_07190 [Acidobacteriota bacterium]